MNTKSLRAWAFVGTVGFVGCKGAASPLPPRSSQVSVTEMHSQTKHEAAGPAFVQHLDATGQDYLYVFEARTEPAPDCSMVRDMQKQTAGLDKGGVVSFAFKGRLKVGANPVDDSGFLSGDRATQSVSMGSAGSEGISLDVTKSDGKTVEGKIVSDPSATEPASGTIFAVVCPGS